MSDKQFNGLIVSTSFNGLIVVCLIVDRLIVVYQMTTTWTLESLTISENQKAEAVDELYLSPNTTNLKTRNII